MAANKPLFMGSPIEWLLYLSPFVFPFYLLRFSYAGVPFTALEVFIYVLFSLWLLGIFSGKKIFIWNRLFKYYWLAALALLFGATFGVLVAPHVINLPSGVVLDPQMTALGVWKGWVVAPMLYFVVLTESFRTEKQVGIILRHFVYSAALVALTAYFLGVVGSGVTYDGRLSGFFESANYLSLYLVPAFVLSLHFFMGRLKTPSSPDYLNLVSLAIMAHALFFTQSYAAIIGVFAAFSLYVGYLLIRHRMGMRHLIAGAGILSFTFVLVLATQWNTPKFQQFIDFKNRSSSSVRLEVYDIAVNLIRENPLTGVGPGLFQANYQTKGPDILGHAPMEWNIPHPHNIFLAFWLNAGFFGLVALLAFLILAHLRFTYPLVALWGMMAHGLFDTPFWKNDLAMIFWLVMGAIVILQINGADSSQKPAVSKEQRAPRSVQGGPRKKPSSRRKSA